MRRTIIHQKRNDISIDSNTTENEKWRNKSGEPNREEKVERKTQGTRQKKKHYVVELNIHFK